MSAATIRDRVALLAEVLAIVPENLPEPVSAWAYPDMTPVVSWQTEDPDVFAVICDWLHEACEVTPTTNSYPSGSYIAITGGRTASGVDLRVTMLRPVVSEVSA